ncbi:MAG: HAD-IC family P-type ATPase [Gammaproteobacteria bacterium]|nr:HAD-IC family P-type ATPase [Gammaproteobacteria bacterium]
MLRQVPYDRIAGLEDAHLSLTEEAVVARRNRFGANNILEAGTAGWRDLLRDTVRDPMLWFLIITGSLFALIGEVKEALILLVALVPLAGMDMFLHRRTQASTASLGMRLASEAVVIRNGQQRTIASQDIVCGDLVVVHANEALPADGILVEAHEAQIDESALTGEAFPVRKHRYGFATTASGDMDGKGIAIDAQHWGFAGTRLLTGSIQLRIVYTGAETYYGEIVQSALQGHHGKTALQTAIANLVTVLLIAATIMCLVVAWVRWSQGFGLLDAVISAMTLAVAALPEEFPVVFTFFLGVGVYRLAKQRALVRRAVAVENIGRVTTICSDKTGTLTLGQLTLTHSFPVAPFTAEELLRIARLASRADSGDPMDQAITAACGVDTASMRYVFTFPFTEDRKRETSILNYADDNLLVVTKGAPEVILMQCQLTDEARQAQLQSAERLAAEGHKVIACAQRMLEMHGLGEHEPDRDFSYAGLIALEDPVREGVAESVRICQQSGIHVIMITGDHPLTARAVANQIGLGHGEPQVVTAEELENQIRAQSRLHLQHVDVIARSIPAQKLHFVRQLQADGEVVAVTGDGVNDVPALQAADIGIAMGERGTRAAREVSAVVLMDDNFRTIVRAIAEGYQLFQNLRLSFAYLLMVHIPLVISAAVIPLSGYPLLYLPVHIVWLELIIHPTALLVFQQLPARAGFAAKKRHGAVRFYSSGEWGTIALVGVLLTVILISGYVFSLGLGRDVDHARAMALAVLCLGSAFLTASLSRLANTASRVIVVAAALSALCLIQIAPLATALHLRPLHWNDWMIALSGSGVIALIPLLLRFARPARHSG